MNVKGLNNRLVESNGVKMLIRINEALDAGMSLSLQEAKELYYLTSLSEQNAFASINTIVKEEVQIIAEEFSTAKVILESLVITEENEALAEDIKSRVAGMASKVKGLKSWGGVGKEKIGALAGKAKGKIKSMAAKAKLLGKAGVAKSKAGYAKGKEMGKAGYERAKPHVQKAAKETAKMGKAVGKAGKASVKAFKGERAAQHRLENPTKGDKLKAYAKAKYAKGVGGIKAHKKVAVGGAVGAGLLGAGLAGHHFLKKKD